jgi:hypothetical protein
MMGDSKDVIPEGVINYHQEFVDYLRVFLNEMNPKRTIADVEDTLFGKDLPLTPYVTTAAAAPDGDHSWAYPNTFSTVSADWATAEAIIDGLNNISPVNDHQVWFLKPADLASVKQAVFIVKTGYRYQVSIKSQGPVATAAEVVVNAATASSEAILRGLTASQLATIGLQPESGTVYLPTQVESLNGGAAYENNVAFYQFDVDKDITVTGSSAPGYAAINITTMPTGGTAGEFYSMLLTVDRVTNIGTSIVKKDGSVVVASEPLELVIGEIPIWYARGMFSLERLSAGLRLLAKWNKSSNAHAEDALEAVVAQVEAIFPGSTTPWTVFRIEQLTPGFFLDEVERYITTPEARNEFYPRCFNLLLTLIAAAGADTSTAVDYAKQYANLE